MPKAKMKVQDLPEGFLMHAVVQYVTQWASMESNQLDHDKEVFIQDFLEYIGELPVGGKVGVGRPRDLNETEFEKIEKFLRDHQDITNMGPRPSATIHRIK